MTSENGGTILSEEEVEAYNARARVLIVSGKDRDDFVNLLDALSALWAEQGATEGAERATDLAAYLDRDE